MTVWALCGLAGFVVAVGSYVATLRGWLHPDTLWYPLIGLVATVLIALSLVDQWNTTTALMQSAFGGVSLYGVVSYLRNKIS